MSVSRRWEILVTPVAVVRMSDARSSAGSLIGSLFYSEWYLDFSAEHAEMREYLSHRDYVLLELYLCGYTTREIANYFSITRERVRQITLRLWRNVRLLLERRDNAYPPLGSRHRHLKPTVRVSPDRSHPFCRT